MSSQQVPTRNQGTRGCQSSNTTDSLNIVLLRSAFKVMGLIPTVSFRLETLSSSTRRNNLLSTKRGAEKSCVSSNNSISFTKLQSDELLLVALNSRSPYTLGLTTDYLFMLKTRSSLTRSNKELIFNLCKWFPRALHLPSIVYSVRCVFAIFSMWKCLQT